MATVVQMPGFIKTVVEDDIEVGSDLLLYSLYAPTWPARKLDKKVTQQAKEANAVKDATEAGNFNKLLLPDCPELKKLNSYVAASRQQFYLRTKSWGETRGSAVGKVEFYEDMLEWLRERRDGLEPLIDALGDVYTESVQKAEFELQGMFRADDYPAWATVKAKFRLDLSAVPLPNLDDIRVMRKVPQHVKEQLAAKIEANVQKALAGTVQEAATVLHKVLAHLSVSLKKYHDGDAKKMYESMLDNVAEIAASVRMTNVTNNKDVEAVAVEAEKLVAGLTTKDLKESEGTQVLVGKKAQELANRIAQFMPQ